MPGAEAAGGGGSSGSGSGAVRPLGVPPHARSADPRQRLSWDGGGDRRGVSYTAAQWAAVQRAAAGTARLPSWGSPAVRYQPTDDDRAVLLSNLPPETTEEGLWQQLTGRVAQLVRVSLAPPRLRWRWRPSLAAAAVASAAAAAVASSPAPRRP